MAITSNNQNSSLNVAYGDVGSNCNRKSFKPNSTKRNHVTKGAILRAPTMMRLAFIGILYYFYNQNLDMLRGKNNEILTYRMDIENIKGVLKEYENDLTAAHSSFRHLQQKTLDRKIEDEADYDDDGYQFDYMSEDERKDLTKNIMDKHHKQSEQIESLKKSIQSFHRNELNRK